MKKNILKFSFLFLAIFIFTAPIYAEDDTTPPTGTILINNGALYTNTREVTLTLSAVDDISDVTEMQFSNGGPYSTPEPYSTTKTWELSASGDGEKNVRVKFKDEAGNITVTGILATITLDTIAPVITRAGAIIVNLNVGKTYTDAGATALDNDVTDLTSSIVTINPVNINTAETYTITYNVADLAGNSATEVIRTVIVTAVIETPKEDTKGNENSSIEKDIVLENSCTVKDTDGAVHTFPQDNSPSKYLAICALAKALEQDFINDFKLTNDPSLGLYVQSINGIEPSTKEYWALWINDKFADCGIGCLSISEGNILSLILTNWETETKSTTIKFHITTLKEKPAPPSGGGGGGGGGNPPQTFFNASNALAYLKNVQSPDGSFGGAPLYTDWTAITFGALNVTDSSKTNLLTYFNSHNTLSPLLTDNERRAIALLALGQNPYSFNNVNYIDAIINSFDGTQFGDINLINDDIFALIPLKNSGYTANDDIIIKDIAFLISKQKTNGSWEESVDITAASIQALKSFELITGVTNALTKATNYLTNAQNIDGGWGNVSSTSWAMQAMSALGASWTKGGHTPSDYLGRQQTGDGAVLSSSESFQNRIWATSYAIVGASLKPWSSIMQIVSKPVIQNNSNTILTNNNKTNLATIDIPIANKKIVSIPETKKLITKATSNLPINTNTEIVNSDTLTATATNAFQDKTIPRNTIPVALGILSGIAILYLGFKFFVK